MAPSIPTECLSCSRTFPAPAERAGGKMRCPKCGKVVPVPGPPADLPPPASASAGTTRTAPRATPASDHQLLERIAFRLAVLVWVAVAWVGLSVLGAVLWLVRVAFLPR